MLDDPVPLSTKLTGEVSLRRLTTADAELFAAHVVGDADRLFEYLPWPRATATPAGAAEMLGLYEHKEDGRIVIAGAFHEDRLLGGALIFHHDPVQVKAELGVWTVAAGEGTGVAYAACRALVALAREQLRVERLEWVCSVDNPRSRALAERLGFTHEGRLRSYFVLNERRHDTDILSLVGHELR